MCSNWGTLKKYSGPYSPSQVSDLIGCRCQRIILFQSPPGILNEQLGLRSPVKLVDSFNLINDHQVGTSISRKMFWAGKIYPKMEFSLEEVRAFY